MPISIGGEPQQFNLKIMLITVAVVKIYDWQSGLNPLKENCIKHLTELPLSIFHLVQTDLNFLCPNDEQKANMTVMEDKHWSIRFQR